MNVCFWTGKVHICSWTFIVKQTLLGVVMLLRLLERRVHPQPPGSLRLPWGLSVGEGVVVLELAGATRGAQRPLRLHPPETQLPGQPESRSRGLPGAPQHRGAAVSRLRRLVLLHLFVQVGGGGVGRTCGGHDRGGAFVRAGEGARHGDFL